MADFNQLVCIKDFYDEAKKKLDGSGTWDYLESGSDEEWALAESRKAFQRWIIRPRFLRDVSRREVATVVLGKVTSMPIGIAPMAMQKLAHPDGEIAMAKAAASVGAIYVLSTMSTCSIEEVAEAVPWGTRLWFQLYFQKDRNVNLWLIHRAVQAGYEALVLTLDTQMVGKRRANMRNPLKLASSMTLANFISTGSETSSEMVARLRDNSKPVRDQAVTWEVIKWIRENTGMKLILKGILTHEDAALAVQHGVNGIIVSNHGGRQLDSVLPPIDALPEVMKGLGDRKSCEVYMDGGISLGSDVFKALALGAKMVFVGRSVLWGLAVGGEEGAVKVMNILKEELDLTMALSGMSKPNQITSASVSKYSPVPVPAV